MKPVAKAGTDLMGPMISTGSEGRKFITKSQDAKSRRLESRPRHYCHATDERPEREESSASLSYEYKISLGT